MVQLNRPQRIVLIIAALCIALLEIQHAIDSELRRSFAVSLCIAALLMVLAFSGEGFNFRFPSFLNKTFGKYFFAVLLPCALIAMYGFFSLKEQQERTMAARYQLETKKFYEELDRQEATRKKEAAEVAKQLKNLVK